MGIVLIDKMIKKKKVTLHKTQKTVVSNYTSLYDCKFHSNLSSHFTIVCFGSIEEDYL